MICSSKFNMGKSVNKTQWANIMMLNNMYFANFRRNNQVISKEHRLWVHLHAQNMLHLAKTFLLTTTRLEPTTTYFEHERSTI